MPCFSWVPKGFLVKVMFEIRSEGTRKEVAKHRLGREQRKGGRENAGCQSGSSGCLGQRAGGWQEQRGQQGPIV